MFSAVVIGDSEKSDAWIEDCSIAMTYMMLRATELGVANCWVQCRNRISQQKIDEPLSEAVEDIAQTKGSTPSEKLVAQRIANNAGDNDNLFRYALPDFVRNKVSSDFWIYKTCIWMEGN